MCSCGKCLGSALLKALSAIRHTRYRALDNPDFASEASRAAGFRAASQVACSPMAQFLITENLG